MASKEKEIPGSTIQTPLLSRRAVLNPDYPQRTETQKTPVCFACGNKMSWDAKAAKGGKYVCRQCPGD